MMAVQLPCQVVLVQLGHLCHDKLDLNTHAWTKQFTIAEKKAGVEEKQGGGEGGGELRGRKKVEAQGRTLRFLTLGTV